MRRSDFDELSAVRTITKDLNPPDKVRHVGDSHPVDTNLRTRGTNVHNHPQIEDVVLLAQHTKKSFHNSYNSEVPRPMFGLRFVRTCLRRRWTKTTVLWLRHCIRARRPIDVIESRLVHEARQWNGVGMACTTQNILLSCVVGSRLNL